jgi:hypothetical protein
MRELTIHVPDNKVALFMELADNLGIKVDKSIQKNILTSEQIALVNEERKKIKENPDQFTDWEHARKTLKLD